MAKMTIRVLGCSGAIAKDCRTTAFLVDQDTLIDAGTGVGDLTLDEMGAVDRVFLTHSHLDHIAALPLMVDAVASRRHAPLEIYALEGTIQALRQHIFNDQIWPDFSRIPSLEAPFVRFIELKIGDQFVFGEKTIEVLPAVHSVPAVGYAVTRKGRSWVFSGDTERNPEFWRRVNQLSVSSLVIETAFSNRERELAKRSLHLSPSVLAEELDHISESQRFPIYITHTKPAETDQIMEEIQRFDQTQPADPSQSHDIRWMRTGQILEI